MRAEVAWNPQRSLHDYDAHLGGRDDRSIALAAAAVLVVVFAAYLRSHALLRAAKQRQCWYEDVEQVAVADTTLRRHQHRWIWAWASPAMATLVATTLIGIVRFPSMPDRLTLHFGAGETGDQFAGKSVGSAFALVFFQAALTVIIVAVAAIAPRAAAPIAPQKPTASVRRYRKDTAVMVRVLLLAAGVNVCMLLAALQIWDGARNMPG